MGKITALSISHRNWRAGLTLYVPTVPIYGVWCCGVLLLISFLLFDNYAHSTEYGYIDSLVRSTIRIIIILLRTTFSPGILEHYPCNSVLSPLDKSVALFLRSAWSYSVSGTLRRAGHGQVRTQYGSTDIVMRPSSNWVDCLNLDFDAGYHPLLWNERNGKMTGTGQILGDYARGPPRMQMIGLEKIGTVKLWYPANNSNYLVFICTILGRKPRLGACDFVLVRVPNTPYRSA